MLSDALGHSGKLWETLWDVLVRSGTFWDVRGQYHSGSLWGAWGGSGALGDVLGRSGTLWETLWETLWDALGHAGTLLDAEGRFGRSGRSGTL